MSSAATISGTAGNQTYRYDGLGRRVQTTDPAVGSPPVQPTTFYVYSRDGQMLYASEARNSINRSYIYLNGSQIATRAKAWSPVNTVTVRYQMTDALGSPVASIQSNNQISTIQRTAYTPWGEASPSVDGTGYTGHVMDANTGLTYMQQRYYDPQMGRFLSVDPAMSEFSRYAYAGNNSFRFTDPDGRVKLDESGNIAFTPTGDPKEQHYTSRISEDMSSVAIVTWVQQPGYIEADDGTRIDASKATSEIMVTVESNGKSTKADVSVLHDGSTPTSNVANCHGTTFAKGQVWIEPSQVGKLLKGDGYVETTAPKPGDVAIFPAEDSPAAHSATVRTTGPNGVETVKSKAGIEPVKIVTPAQAWPTVPTYYTR